MTILADKYVMVKVRDATFARTPWQRVNNAVVRKWMPKRDGENMNINLHNSILDNLINVFG